MAARLGRQVPPTPEQPSPDGLAQAFIIGETFLDGRRRRLVLDDNIFYGHDLPIPLASGMSVEIEAQRCSPITCSVPERYGVVEFDKRFSGGLDRGETGGAKIELTR